MSSLRKRLVPPRNNRRRILNIKRQVRWERRERDQLISVMMDKIHASERDMKYLPVGANGNVVPEDKFAARQQLSDLLNSSTEFILAVSLIAHASYGWGFFDKAVLPMIVRGEGAWGGDPGCFAFPDELVVEYGGDEAQYGYIEFEIYGMDEIDHAPFNEAFALFEIASKHYADFRPDRREFIETEMRKARKTFDRLIAEHEAWKKANKVS